MLSTILPITLTALAFAKGVELGNLEFIQYHPTTVGIPGKRMLISEAARGEGKVNFEAVWHYAGLMLLCYVASMKLTSAANAIVLEYTAPIFVIIFEAIIFQRRIHKLDVIVCLLVLLGIGIVVIDGLGEGHLLGDVIALASGVFYAFTIMLNEFENGDNLSSVLFGHILMVIIGFPFFLLESSYSASAIVLVVCLGIFQAGAGYTLLSVGLRYADPIPASMIASVEPVLNPILVALFYHEKIGINAIIGGLIVIISIAVYNILLLKQEKR